MLNLHIRGKVKRARSGRYTPAHLHLCESCDYVLAEVFEACHKGNAYAGLCAECAERISE